MSIYQNNTGLRLHNGKITPSQRVINRFVPAVHDQPRQQRPYHREKREHKRRSHA